MVELLKESEALFQEIESRIVYGDTPDDICKYCERPLIKKPMYILNDGSKRCYSHTIDEWKICKTLNVIWEAISKVHLNLTRSQRKRIMKVMEDLI